MTKGGMSMSNNFRKKAARLSALGVIAILAPLLVLSDQSIKAIYDRWFHACTIVFGKKVVKHDNLAFFEVNLFVRGSPPAILPLTFSTNGAARPKIKSVMLVRDLMVRNRAFHPLSAQTCPGDLCPEVSLDNPVSDIEIKIPNFLNMYNYSFKIFMGNGTDFSSDVDKDDLIVYAVYDGTDESGCRLEKKDVLNVLVWLNEFWRWFILSLIVICLTICLGILRRSGADESAA